MCVCVSFIEPTHLLVIAPLSHRPVAKKIIKTHLKEGEKTHHRKKGKSSPLKEDSPLKKGKILILERRLTIERRKDPPLKEDPPLKDEKTHH